MQTDPKKKQPKITHKTLDQRVLDYWKVSRVWNGRGGVMRVGDALKITYNIAMTSDPHSRLARLARDLEHAIINHQHN